MNNISLDNRLKDIASLVDKCDSIADVGTDHGYLPIYLILNGKANIAYASDIAIGPLNKAIENIHKYNLHCDATNCIFNHNNECLSNGITMLSLEKGTECLNYFEK